jgi:hypothetical protein
MKRENEHGIELLRRVVGLFDTCNETFNYRWTPEQLLKLAQVCWDSGWDFYPDQYTERQLHEARTCGILPKWDHREKPVYDPIPFKHIQDHLVSKYDLTAQLTLDQYTEVIERARELWGDKVGQFLMDCFMPEGEAVEPGYEDSLSHYTFNAEWLEMEQEWTEFLQEKS